MVKKPDNVNAIIKPTIALNKTVSNTTLDDILKNSRNTKNAYEEGFNKISDKLFDRESLYMISRLDTNMTYYIVKQIIVESVFFQFWVKKFVEFTFIKTNKYPFYKIEANEIDNTEMEIYILNVFINMIKDILSLTISFEGKGRTEGLAIIEAAKNKIMELEAAQAAGTLNKFTQ
jgi:hypothetical protein